MRRSQIGLRNEVADQFYISELAREVETNPLQLLIGLSFNTRAHLDDPLRQGELEKASYNTIVKTRIDEAIHTLKVAPSWFQAVVAESQDQQVVMMLLRAALIFHENGINPPQHSIDAGPKSCARWLVGKMVGTDFLEVLGAKEYSSNFFRELTLATGQLSEAVEGYRLDQVLHLTPENFTKSNRQRLIAICSSMATLLMMGETLIDIRRLVHSEITPLEVFSKPLALPPEQLDQITSKLIDRQRVIFTETFNLSNEVSMDDISKLETQWSGLAPWYVMQAYMRDVFSQNEDDGWFEAEEEDEDANVGKAKSAASPIAQIIQHSLAGTFHAFKYQDGMPTEQRQIGFMSSEAEAAWRSNPISLAPVRATKNEPNDVNEMIQDLCESNILPHIKEAVESEWSKKATDKLLEIKSAVDSHEISLLWQHAKDIQSESAKYDLQSNQFRQIRNDLKEVIKICGQSNSAEKSNDRILLNVITDDPNLLIQIGRVVDASSCQDYLVGSHRMTLPGYVLDGNIKAAIGFNIDVGTFHSAGYSKHDFQAAFEALLDRPDDVKYTFNAANKTLAIVFEDRLFRITFDKAMRRNILRAGVSPDGKTKIIIERPYLQIFEGGPQLKKSLNACIQSFSNSVAANANKADVAYFPASRNSFGVYTDAGYGVKIGPYEIRASAEKPFWFALTA